MNRNYLRGRIYWTGCIECFAKNIIYIPVFILSLLMFCISAAGQDSIPTPDRDNIYAKSRIVDKRTIKLRWSPANPKAWSAGKKYGYTVERYTVMVNKVWQDSPAKLVIDKKITPLPLADWERAINSSDYAAAIAQAFYGEDFNLTATSGDIGNIINQANELEQRFAASVFMAEYGYKAAEMAGWAWTDTLAKPDEKYLYRIYLNRPERIKGDTAVVFTGYDEKREMPKPLGLKAVFGDKSVMLSWNYAFLASDYHSYHVERMAAGEKKFSRITELPVSVLTEGMTGIMYTDSLRDNKTEYSYRIYGLTGFGEVSPFSDTIRGKGRETVSCIPYILAGTFTGKDAAIVYWEFDCPRIEWVDRLQIWRSPDPDSDFSMIADSISVRVREYSFVLADELNYVKLVAVNRDGTQKESFPFLLRQTDSIPPAIPTGLRVTIDTFCVAHLEWDANNEPDFRGYRILRGFTETEEKSSITPDFIPVNEYTDTLSPNLFNTRVYYALTAIDMRYNESLHSETTIAVKPNRATPDEPVFTGYEIESGSVKLSWITDTKQPDVTYTLMRRTSGKEDEKAVFTGDCTKNVYTDEPEETGDYRYWIIASAADGKKSVSPNVLELHINAEEDLDAVSGFRHYADRKRNYIELSWRRHEKAQKYRIYKAEDGKSMSLWKEIDNPVNQIIDEHVSVDTKYSYTIVFVSEGRTSKSKTIVVNF